MIERKVLDYGYVRLVDSMGNDLSIVRSARVSYDAEWRTGENEGADAKLISYLWRNKHTSPFESVELQFEIKCPLFVARQWHRHRTWSYNEVSARYTELPEEYYVPELEQITGQSIQNKQMRTGQQHPEAVEIANLIDFQCKEAFRIYKHLIGIGAPRELARAVLPTATYTRFFAKTNLLNLFRFLTLRLHSHAQYEIRVYAEAMFNLITPIVPVAVKTFAEEIYGTNL